MKIQVHNFDDTHSNKRYLQGNLLLMTVTGGLILLQIIRDRRYNQIISIKECHFHSSSHQNDINGYLLYVKRVVILLASANLNLLFTIGLDIFGHIAM